MVRCSRPRCDTAARLARQCSPKLTYRCSLATHSSTTYVAQHPKSSAISAQVAEVEYFSATRSRRMLWWSGRTVRSTRQYLRTYPSILYAAVQDYGPMHLAAYGRWDFHCHSDDRDDHRHHRHHPGPCPGWKKPSDELGIKRYVISGTDVRHSRP